MLFAIHALAEAQRGSNTNAKSKAGKSGKSKALAMRATQKTAKLVSKTSKSGVKGGKSKAMARSTTQKTTKLSSKTSKKGSNSKIRAASGAVAKNGVYGKYTYEITGGISNTYTTYSTMPSITRRMVKGEVQPWIKVGKLLDWSPVKR
jgi:hypothetical protein